MIRDYFALAIKNISKRRLRSWLTMIGIFIGIAAVVSLIGLGEGLRVAISSQFGFLSTDVVSVQAGGVQAGPPGSGAIHPLTTSLADKIGRLIGVKAAIPRLVRVGSMEFNGKTIMAYAASVPDGKNRKEIERIANIEVQEGRLLKDSDSAGVVVGANFLKDEKLGKPVGLGQRIIYEGKSFQVIGVLKKKGSFIIDNAIILNENVMREIYNDKEVADIIVVVAKDTKEIDTVKLRVEKLLRKERDVKEGEEDFSVQTSQNALKTLNETLFAVQLFVYIIAGISLLVGGIGIMNTMYTAVLERTKEIGVMKAIGARNSTIFTLFFIESGLLGTVGGLIGIILGVSLAKGLSFIGNLVLSSGLIMTNFSMWLIFGALFFSFLIGSSAGIVPALSASKMKPVDALRYAK